MRSVCLLLVILVAVLVAPVQATTYYVSGSTGSNSNSGAKDNPFQTINKGLSVMGARDTLLIREGTYTEELNTDRGPLPSGTSWSNPVTIAAAPGETVTIMGRLVLNTRATAYMIFDGLIIDGSNFGGTAEVVYQSNGAHHLRIQNCEIRNAGGQGIQNGDAGPGLEYIRNKIHHNGRNPAADGSESHGMYLSAPGMLLDGNEVYANPGYGIQLYHQGASRGDDSILRNNYVHDNTGSGGGVVIAMASRVQFYNNVLANNTNGGLDISYGAPVGTMVYHNTFIGAHYAVQNFHSAKGTIIRNNIADIHVAGSEVIFGDRIGDVTFANNLCRTAGAGCALVGDPQLVNTGTRDVHLQPGSPAIKAGPVIGIIGLFTDYYGAARPESGLWDLGASAVVGPTPPQQLPAPTDAIVFFDFTGAAPAAVFTWSFPADQGQEHFVVYEQAIPSGSWTLVATVEGTARTARDPAVVRGQRYRWVIRAVNAQRESPPTPYLMDTVPVSTLPLTCTGYVENDAAQGFALVCTPQGSPTMKLSCTGYLAGAQTAFTPQCLTQ